MADPRHIELGQRFDELHEHGTFVMFNVADAGTAKALSEAGVAAVATNQCTVDSWGWVCLMPPVRGMSLLPQLPIKWKPRPRLLMVGPEFYISSRIIPVT